MHGGASASRPGLLHLHTARRAAGWHRVSAIRVHPQLSQQPTDAPRRSLHTCVRRQSRQVGLSAKAGKGRRTRGKRRRGRGTEGEGKRRRTEGYEGYEGGEHTVCGAVLLPMLLLDAIESSRRHQLRHRFSLRQPPLGGRRLAISHAAAARPRAGPGAAAIKLRCDPLCSGVIYGDSALLRLDRLGRRWRRQKRQPNYIQQDAEGIERVASVAGRALRHVLELVEVDATCNLLEQIVRGKKARFKKARRHEGTKARRHEGKKIQGDIRTLRIPDGSP